MQEFIKNNNEIKSPVSKVYDLFNVKNSEELYDLYFEQDQELMNSQNWDDNNENLITNKIKNTLEEIEDNKLTEEEKSIKNQILWFWYHHATSFALFQNKNKEKAKIYAQKSLNYKLNDNPNKISELLYFLANDNLEEAQSFIKSINDSAEKETALNLIEDYKSLNLVS